MPEETDKHNTRLLDPVNRVSEAIFGLVMALTFTCALSAAEAHRDEIWDMTLAALGCNLAWGLVDAVMFLMTSFIEHAHGLRALKAIRTAGKPEQAHRIILDALPPVAASAMSAEGVEAVRRNLMGLTDVPSRPRLKREDWLGAIAVFFWVFVSTFPVVIPFMVIHEPITALRVSNLVALVLLFAGGYVLGAYAQHRPWRLGLLMALVGTALVAVTIALGG